MVGRGEGLTCVEWVSMTPCSRHTPCQSVHVDKEGQGGGGQGFKAASDRGGVGARHCSVGLRSAKQRCAEYV